MKKPVRKPKHSIKKIKEDGIRKSIALIGEAGIWAFLKLDIIKEEIGVSWELHETKGGKEYFRIMAPKATVKSPDKYFIQPKKVIKRGTITQCLEFMLMQWKAGVCYKLKQKSTKSASRKKK